MKKIFLKLLMVLSLALQYACEKIIVLPVQGDIEGIVTDNNGELLAGITVTAGYEAPTESGRPETRSKTFVTGSNGYYRLSDLWDEVLIQVNHPGFEPASVLLKIKESDRNPTADLKLKGSPTIRGLTFDKTVLTSGTSHSQSDSIFFRIEIEDAYSSQVGSYRAKLLLEDSAGNTQSIINTSMEEQSLNRSLLYGVITGENLSPGSYGVIAEVIDPDENSHQVISSETILIE